jgi:hypothetical protein
VGASDLVGLDCRAGTLVALQSGLEQFGRIEAADWLTSAVWLKASDCDFLATSVTRVLSDGYIGRPLSIARADDFARQLRSELPDISTRLTARQNGLELPEPARPAPPAILERPPACGYTLQVLIRMAERASCSHRIACALRFDFEDGRFLLVGTDVGTLAMVLSDDPGIVGRYSAACDAIPAKEYLAYHGG